MSREAGLPYQSDTSSSSDDSEDGSTIYPRGIYTMEEYVAEHSVMYNLLERIRVKIQAKVKARQAGKSSRRTGFHRKVTARDHGADHQRLVAEFFSENPVCDEKIFRTKYRMSRPLFLRIVEALGEWSPYFTNRTDVCYRQGLSPLQKSTAAIRMLARGCPADAVDEYVQIGRSTAVECLERFAEGVIEKFGREYLRGPTSVDMQRLLQTGEGRGFPGMLGSIGCMHWEWENCPPKWMRRLNHSDHGFSTFILEAVASQDLWIWHASFNVVGSINDISVLSQSPLFTELLEGKAPPVQFSINKIQYDMGYYLADEIYPECTVLVKTIPFPRTEKERLFSRQQEEARKDVHRAFGVLQSRFPIVRGPIRFFQRAALGKILQACVILHNMAVEDEKDMASAYSEPDEASGITAVLPSSIKTGPAHCLTSILQRSATICSQPTQGQLKGDLVEHIWQQFGPFGDNEPTVISLLPQPVPPPAPSPVPQPAAPAPPVRIDESLFGDFKTCVFRGLKDTSPADIPFPSVISAAQCAFSLSTAAASGKLDVLTSGGENVGKCCDRLNRVLQDKRTQGCVCDGLLKVVAEKRIDLDRVCKRLGDGCKAL